jgi:hypothetical protein
VAKPRLEKRISDLEAAAGGRGTGECERCRATLIIRIAGEATSVTKHGRKWLEGLEAKAYAAQEEPSRRCPLCGAVRKSMGKVGGYRAS